jgi:hypothetical protein
MSGEEASYARRVKRAAQLLLFQRHRTPGVSLPAADAQASGWRIDDLAALTATLTYLASRQGKAPRGEVERLLSSKLPSWRVGIALDRFVRLGYLHEDENEVLTVGWRTRAEVDLETLTESLLISEEPSELGERES